MRKVYSLTDLSDAKAIMARPDLITGTNAEVADWFAWAKDVIRFFGNLYTYAKGCTGDWGCRLKMAWNWIKGFIANKLKQLGAAAKKIGGRLLADGTIYLAMAGKYEFKPQTQKIKSHKHRFLTNRKYI